MEIELDFSEVNNLDTMHEVLKKAFGFPDFYGKNVNALIDCWTSLRYPEDGMTQIHIGADEMLTIKIVSFPFDKHTMLNHFFIAVQAVNLRYTNRGEKAVISMILV